MTTCPWHSLLVATKGSSARSVPKTLKTPTDTITWLHNKQGLLVNETWNDPPSSKSKKKKGPHFTVSMAQYIPPKSWPLTCLLERTNKSNQQSANCKEKKLHEDARKDRAICSPINHSRYEIPSRSRFTNRIKTILKHITKWRWKKKKSIRPSEQQAY